MVENGVPLVAAAKLPKRRNYALMLSRICPEKSLHTGLEAARMSGVPILLAGDTFPYEEHLRYVRNEIEPRLGERIDGRTVAVLYTLVDSPARLEATPRNRRMYSYLIGFDPDPADLSPGCCSPLRLMCVRRGDLRGSTCYAARKDTSSFGGLLRR